LDILSATQPSNAFRLTWAGSDNLSGIDYIEIQQKIGTASWTTFPAIDGSLTYYWIVGNPGSTYAYRMHGVDHSGNTELYPSSAETTTAVPEATVLCYSRDPFDSSGNNDNSPEHASVIYADGASQNHNFCNPLSPNFQNDEDWTRLSVTNGEHILVKSTSTSLPSATVISLYAQDGHTLLAQASPSAFGKDTFMIWTSDSDQQVYIRIQHLDGRVIGSDVGATLTVKSGELTYLPVISNK
jgi:hypothetical protein